ncbi:PulJ/GspJ family protein [Aliidiomarina sp. Khilg15.8]
MPKHKQGGFTLLELVLVMGLSGFLLLAWSSAMTALWSDSARTTYRAQQAQHFFQFGLWLAYELERAREGGVYRWQVEPGCVIFGDHGVRLQDGMMQWRPANRGCSASGWISMYDPNGFRMQQFELIDQTPAPPLMRLSGSYEGASWEWQYQFRGPVVLE